MELKNILQDLSLTKNYISSFLNQTWDRKQYRQYINNVVKKLLQYETLKDEKTIEKLADLADFINVERNDTRVKNYIINSEIINNLDLFIEEKSKASYGEIRIDFETYNLKTILYYEEPNKNNSTIAYMAGSFYTDQEYRTFLANIQKGKSRLTFFGVSRTDSMYNLSTVKDGYLSRVKKSVNANTSDGYHADFHLNNGRFFLLKDNDNPVDIVYNWIVKNTQAAVLEDWKSYLYNSLVEKGLILQCKGYNYTDINLKGIVLSEEITTDTIRELRKEGLDLKEISIPREPVNLDPSMTFIEAMNNFIIPEIVERETLYKVGDPFSEHIESPIIMKKGNKLIKTSLFPRQKVMAQGMLNGIKAGRRNLFLNGGMGIGKTFLSIKLSYAAIRDYFKKDSGRISVYCQSHLIFKWKRQFQEALPNVPLKFIKIDSYKDVMNLEGGKPEGIEVYLLPKDKVKRKYLEEFAAIKGIYNLSVNSLKFIDNVPNDNKSNIFIANNIKLSEMKVVARRLEKKFGKYICIAKEVVDNDGEVIGYKVVTTSNVLKNKFKTTNKAYDFFIKELEEIKKYEDKIEAEYKEKLFYSGYMQRGLICPSCGGFIYNNAEHQLSEDNWKDNLFSKPSTKSDKNKKCLNYVKVDDTPLTKKERMLLIKGELDYIVSNDIKEPYINSDDSPIIDIDTLKEIKAGKYKDRYTIVLKQCNSPLWTAEDKKGYRTVNSIDVLERRFGKKFFDISISDEAHLYSAESSQGETFAKLCRMSKINLALTGTLTGGKASHLFYMLYRMLPSKMSKIYKYDEVSKFIDHYGRRKKVTKEYKNNETYNKSGQGKVTSSGWNEIPGLSPMLYSHFLSDIMVSRKIEDMGFEMPDLKFFKHEIEMSPELKEGYDKLKTDIVNFMKANKDINLGGTYLNALLSYPDMPLTDPLMYGDMLISNPLPLDIENIILPKEQKLIETVKRELRQNRRVVVYVTYTGTKGVDRRVETILKNEGVKVAVLKSSVNTEKREQWIEDRCKEGIEVLVCNPILVQTGLDLLQFPTFYFMEIPYDVRVVRQSESRGYRPFQDKECRVFYSYYAETIQHDALKLIGSKKKASLALEGVFAEDILSASGDDVGDSGAAALYKSLLGQVKLKEDDLDFFSEEEELEIIEEETTKPVGHKQEVINTQTQLSFFTMTEEVLKEAKISIKKKVVVGQISLFEM